jgi:hypothetical protein
MKIEIKAKIKLLMTDDVYRQRPFTILQPHTQANQELNRTGSKPIGARERTM